MSLSNLPGRSQEEILQQILNMSTQELSDNLQAKGMSADGDKATKQARLLAAALAQVEDQDVDISRHPESLNQRVDALEDTLQEVLQQLKKMVANPFAASVALP